MGRCEPVGMGVERAAADAVAAGGWDRRGARGACPHLQPRPPAALAPPLAPIPAPLAHLQQHGLVAAVVLGPDEAHRGVVAHHEERGVEEVGLLGEQRGLRGAGGRGGARVGGSRTGGVRVERLMNEGVRVEGSRTGGVRVERLMNGGEGAYEWTRPASWVGEERGRRAGERGAGERLAELIEGVDRS